MAEPRRIRKTYEICRSVLRNAAYFAGGSAVSRAHRKSEFAKVASNNFLDMAFLDWCKMFGDKRAKHHWAKILPEESDFHAGLMKRLRLTGEEFETQRIAVRHYRDKEIAHADEYEVMDIPLLKPVIESAIYLHERLRADCGFEPQPAPPHDLKAAFQLATDEASQQFVAMATIPS